jgi:hypothetical protein
MGFSDLTGTFFHIIFTVTYKAKKMENVSILNNDNLINNKIQVTDFSMEKPSRSKTGFSIAIKKVIAEGGENFFLYLKRLNLAKESNLLVLSSSHHYYYDENELQDVKTLINLKKLNQIKDLNMFLHTLFNILPQNSSFIGCFSNDKTLSGNGFSNYPPSRLFSRFINFLDSKTDHIMDKNEVSELLETNGFRVVDMTEIDGITYFYSQNIRQTVKLRA